MRRTLLTVVLCCSISQVAYAQEQPQPHAPWLNAFGRFWGIGYSAGYHAQTNSRLGLHHYSPDQNVVPQPPRGLHANPNLYAGQAGSSYAVTNSMVGPMMGPTPAPVMQPGGHQNSLPSTMQQHNMVPAPPKPVDPPPNWLKQYIKPNADVDRSSSDELLNDNSPSDRKGVMLSPSPSDSTTSISITPMQPSVQIGGRPVISVLQQ